MSRFVLSLVARIPLAILHALGAILGWAIYGLSPTYRRRLRANLEVAGYRDAGTRRAAIAGAGRMLAELPAIWLRPRAEVIALVRSIDGREHLEAARAAGKGIVFLTPHLGCFEITAQFAADAYPITALYRPPKFAWLRTAVEQWRARENMHLARVGLAGVRGLVAALARHEAVGILPDQVPGEGRGEWADFFGKPAYTMTLAGMLAERPGSTCLLAYGERLRGGAGYVLRIRPLAAARPGETPTRRVNAAIEALIRECPAQYLWGYNRYKRPRGAPPKPGADSPVTRAVIGLLWLIQFLPPRAIAAIGSATGALLYWLIPQRRAVTRVNLAKCFPDMEAAARESLARAHFRAIGRAFFDHALLWWAPRARIERLVRIDGLEHLQTLKGTPVILLVPHFVGLDAGAIRLACEANCTAIYARQTNPLFDEFLRRGRNRFGDQRTYSRQDGIRPVLARMREGRPLYYLPDQDYGPRDTIFVPFFGVPAATIPGLSRIARVAQAKVLPCVTRMLPGGAGYVLRIEPAWDNFPTDDLIADTRRMNAYIEQCIADMPEQYNWMHRRFKTRPAGDAGFYRESR